MRASIVSAKMSVITRACRTMSAALLVSSGRRQRRRGGSKNAFLYVEGVRRVCERGVRNSVCTRGATKPHELHCTSTTRTRVPQFTRTADPLRWRCSW